MALFSKRVLIVYPWTERHFGGFGDIFTATAVLSNPKVAEHGRVVLRALDAAVNNMDNIKGTYAALSRLHYEELQVDPDNFRVSYVFTLRAKPQPATTSKHHNIDLCDLFLLQLLADCITIAIACKLKSALDPQNQAIWQKFLSAVVDAMSSQYN